MPIDLNELPPGVPGMSAGGAGTYQVPSVAAARSTGLPIAGYFQSQQPTIPSPLPSSGVQPVSMLDRILAAGRSAVTGIQNLIGNNPLPNTSPAPARTTDLESDLDALERRSTVPSPSPNILQVRQSQAIAAAGGN